MFYAISPVAYILHFSAGDTISSPAGPSFALLVSLLLSSPHTDLNYEPSATTGGEGLQDEGAMFADDDELEVAAAFLLPEAGPDDEEE